MNSGSCPLYDINALDDGHKAICSSKTLNAYKSMNTAELTSKGVNMAAVIDIDVMAALAAAMYATLDDRRFKKLLNSFSVLVELVPGSANDEVLFGGTISGHIQINSIHRREFTIQYTFDGDHHRDIKVEVSSEYCDAKEPVEINKRVHDFNMKNVAWWDWQAVKSVALDIIGMILGEENS